MWRRLERFRLQPVGFVAARGMCVRKLPQSLFDIYALSLPRGHGFGRRPPIGAWQSEDGRACGVLTRDDDEGTFGIMVMRRRVDGVWTVTAQEHGFGASSDALAKMPSLLKEGTPAELMPANTAPRPALHDLQGRKPSDTFKVLFRPSHHVAAWLLNQVYLALPDPDKNWAGDCQTGNFHTRLWEAQLLASLREQGLLVTQPHPSPDFRIENRLGQEAWVEAVTANPPVPYNHVNTPPSSPPQAVQERFLGPAAVRFAKTLGSKLQRGYHQLAHVANRPFVIALADFHAPASMVWSREALIGYLYGLHAEVIEVDGRRSAAAVAASHLLGSTAFPAGLFCNDGHGELSAVISSNACSIAKFNRVGVSAGAAPRGLRYVRLGMFFDRTPGALEGVPFCLDITSAEYRGLWPQHFEPWSAELEVFHNPYARYPLSRNLIPEGTHWFARDGEIVCEAFYQTSILWSQTMNSERHGSNATVGRLCTKLGCGALGSCQRRSRAAKRFRSTLSSSISKMPRAG